MREIDGCNLVDSKFLSEVRKIDTKKRFSSFKRLQCFLNKTEYCLYREMISKTRTNIEEIVYKHRFNNATIK